MSEYYMNLDLNIPSHVTAEAIESILYGTMLQGLGVAFVAAENKYVINAMYLLAHAIHESDFGRSRICRLKNNLFGFAAYDSSPEESATDFDSLAACIDYCAGYIKRQYLTPGGDWYEGPTLTQMNIHYAKDKLWASKIANWIDNLYKQLPVNDYEGHWARDIITEALELGIVKGYDNGSFHPDGSMTRAEATAMVMAAVKYVLGK